MYSNCLFEAIKAKIKDPKNVHIHILSPKLNNGDFHIYWYDNTFIITPTLTVNLQVYCLQEE